MLSISLRTRLLLLAVLLMAVAALSLSSKPVLGSSNICAQNVSEASGFSLVYTLPIPLNADYNNALPPYSVDSTANIGPFDRIGYCLQLDNDWVWVSMDAFTAVPAQIGVPVFSTGATFQQTVSNMNVSSNVSGIVNGTGIATGNIEFWHKCYNTPAFLGLPGASDGVYDFDDTFPPIGSDRCYGSMQVHSHGTGANLPQTVFAYNRWDDSSAIDDDLGIGNNPGTHPDWTFQANAGTYTIRALDILVRQVPITLNSGSASTQVSTDGGNTFAPAVIVTTNIPPQWETPISGTQYINCGSDAGASCGLNKTLIYTTTFNLPVGFGSPSLNACVHADNRATIFLNSTKIGQQPLAGANFSGPPECFATTTAALFQAGSNTLQIDVLDAGGSAGLDYQATVTFTTDTTTTGTKTITTDTTLTEDHDGNIVIDADNVTLDCDGHKVTGVGTGIGVLLVPGSQFVTVKNCHVSNFARGIFVDSICCWPKVALYNTFEKNTVEDNWQLGVGLSNSSFSTVVGNTAINNFCGIQLFRSSQNTVTKNTATGGRYGICLGNSRENMLTENEAVSARGFNLNSSSDNTLMGNTASGSNWGFLLEGSSSGNELKGNVAEDNIFDGFSLWSSDLNELKQNTARRNGGFGFALYSAFGNTLKGNTAENNPRRGFHLSASSDNTLMGNSASGSNNGFVLEASSSRNKLKGNTGNLNTFDGFVLVVQHH